MSPTRKIITAVITVLALAGCFVAFRREGKAVVEKQAATESPAPVVKGAEKTTSAVSTDYSTSAMASHLELTPGNVIWFTNYYRKQNGLKTLSTASKLNRSSSDKLSEMLKYQYFDHTRPGSTRTFDAFIDAENYDFIKIGENLAMGDFKTSKEVVDAWMKSPDHRKNILDPVYTNIGVSVQTGSMNGTKTYLFVQHFGKPRSDCPTVDDSMSRAIASLKSSVSSARDQIQTKEGEVAQTSQADPSQNEIIDEYNQLVDSYNILANKLGGIVTEYNKQVTDYDKCVQGKN
ncbi:MAG: YkwD protein [Patescibacteria group bacterium]|nr:YkwD protein [Patescibacteria group bacterium]